MFYNALGLLSASWASEYLPLVTEVPEIVVGFGPFCRNREFATVRTGWALFHALLLVHEAEAR